MLVQAFLGGLVVVRGHQQATVGTGLHGALSQMQRLAGGVGAGASDHRNPPLDLPHHLVDHRDVFLIIERRRFAGGTDGDDGIGAVVDMKLHQPRQRFEIQRAVRAHRGNDRHHAATKHNLILSDFPNNRRMVRIPSDLDKRPRWAARGRFSPPLDACTLRFIISRLFARRKLHP